MIKNIIKISTFCFVGSLLLTSNVTKVKATSIAGELPVAGISLSLDNYYEKTLAAELLESANLKMLSSSLAQVAISNTQEQATDTANETQEADAKVEEEEKSKYENIGIAVVDNHLNIREKPGEDAKIVGKLPKDAGCTIYDIDSNGWAKIKSGKVSGYVMSTYLATGEEAEELAKKVGMKTATVVGTQTLRVREEASTDSATLTLIPIDEELEVIKEFKEWVKVSIDNDEGFVSKDFISISYELKKAVSDQDLQEDTKSGVTSLRASIVAFAKQFLGNRYVWGGTSLTNGADCSGFVMSIYRNFGYSLKRTSSAQAAGNGTSISASNARPGDLIFYGGSGRISHVAMYIGNGQVIHASNARSGIKISNMYYRTPVKAKRIIND